MFTVASQEKVADEILPQEASERHDEWSLCISRRRAAAQEHPARAHATTFLDIRAQFTTKV